MDVGGGKSKGKRPGAPDDQFDPWALDREGGDWAEPVPRLKAGRGGHGAGSAVSSAPESEAESLSTLGPSASAAVSVVGSSTNNAGGRGIAPSSQRLVTLRDSSGSEAT
eukprot:2064919-Lingulodinium_polyedra.AAC.1